MDWKLAPQNLFSGPNREKISHFLGAVTGKWIPTAFLSGKKTYIQLSLDTFFNIRQLQASFTLLVQPTEESPVESCSKINICI